MLLAIIPLRKLLYRQSNRGSICYSTSGTGAAPSLLKVSEDFRRLVELPRPQTVQLGRPHDGLEVLLINEQQQHRELFSCLGQVLGTKNR